jgi:hypothetical protein
MIVVIPEIIIRHAHILRGYGSLYLAVPLTFFIETRCSKSNGANCQEHCKIVTLHLSHWFIISSSFLCDIPD